MHAKIYIIWTVCCADASRPRTSDQIVNLTILLLAGIHVHNVYRRTNYDLCIVHYALNYGFAAVKIRPISVAEDYYRYTLRLSLPQRPKTSNVTSPYTCETALLCNHESS
jgi:hypothetical protein